MIITYKKVKIRYKTNLCNKVLNSLKFRITKDNILCLIKLLLFCSKIMMHKNLKKINILILV